jgi:hypothetical protein
MCIVTKEFNISVGCVQGSSSGPYLFTLLIDGISEYLSDDNVVVYADDMYFIFESDTWEDVTKIAAEETKKQFFGCRSLVW